MKRIKIKTGTDLRRFRKSVGMTQKQLADAFGFSVRKNGKTESGYIQAMESGRRPVSRLTILLCQKLLDESGKVLKIHPAALEIEPGKKRST